MAMPVQVPHGHIMQQIVDENGTLRHVILSTQAPFMQMPPFNNGPQSNGPPNGPHGFYQYGPPFHGPTPPFPPNINHAPPSSSPLQGMSPPPQFPGDEKRMH